AYGAARTIADPGWLRDFVRRLTERHEAREPAPPWRMADLPETYVQSMLTGIVGVEIAVSRLDGKFKLSQNRPVADRLRIVAALSKSATAASSAHASTASAVRRSKPARAKAASSRRRSVAARRNGPRWRRRAKVQAAASSGSPAPSPSAATAAAASAAPTPLAASPAAIRR